MSFEAYIRPLIPLISNILNGLSASSSVIVIIIYFTLVFYRYDLVERVSLKLQVGISVIDFFNGCFALFHHTVKSGPFCVFIGFWRAFGEEMYCLLNVAIAVNLQLIFVHSIKPKKRWEIFYWIFPIITSLTLSLIPLGMGLYGLNKGKVCFIIEDGPGSYPLILLNTSVIFSLTVLYLLVVSIMIITKLVKDKGTVLSMSHLGDTPKLGPREELVKKLRKLIIRVSLYPIAAIVGLSGFIAAYILSFLAAGQRNIYISVWGMFGISTKGIINMITFFLDPTIQYAIPIVFRSVYISLKTKVSGSSSIDDIHNQVEINSLSTIENPSSSPCNDTQNIRFLERYL